MCLGGSAPRPQQPQIIYQGPTEEERRRDREASDARLALYQTQMEEQQALFQQSLQEQIDAANEETERLTGLFEEQVVARQERDAARAAEQEAAEATAAAQSAADAAAAEAAAAARAEQASYTTTVESVAAPVSAETTESIQDTKKKKKKSNLKIGAGGAVKAAPGTGLNIGT